MARKKVCKRLDNPVAYCPTTREAFCASEVVADFFREVNVPENAIPVLLEKCGPGTAWDDWKEIANEWLAANGGPLIIDDSALAENASEPEPAEQRGVAARDAKFWEWYEAHGTETWHKPKAIWSKWNGMKQEETIIR